MFAEGQGRRFVCDAIFILLGKRKTVGPDRPLPAVSKVISRVGECPNVQENSRKKQTAVLCNGNIFQ